ncbi:pheromone-regulated membrane protein [Aspergillus sclerotialis]|uniref:Pheromone-regulated membrane protein n=1 Tax=Aspergillus sclerotialis TaxID=2070753 RepID=A0A3A2ZPM4_9EURO|nr:pheromone-regulated membrane protein [Aspergillus sclerotialis]
MAGGYFDLPLSSSRRSSISDASGGTSKSSPALRATPSPNPVASHQGKYLDPAVSHGRTRGPGILKSANRVKFTVSEAGLGRISDESTPDAPFDGKDPMPQKPPPAANVLSAGDAPVIPPFSPVVETRSNAPVDGMGLTIHSTTSSPGIGLGDDIGNEKGRAIHSAQERAQRLASVLGRSSKSPKPSPRSSLPSSIPSTPTEAVTPSEYGDEVPMINLSEKHFEDYLTDEDDAGSIDSRSSVGHTIEADQLVRQMAQKDVGFLSRIRAASSGFRSGQSTPVEDPEMYVERPTHYRGGILSTLLKLYDQPTNRYTRGRYGHTRYGSSGDLSVRGLSPDPDWRAQGRRKWYDKSCNQSTISLSGSTPKNYSMSPKAMLKRSRSNGSLRGATKFYSKTKLEDEIRITVHIAELLSRQRYLIMLCRALMKYGAPTHRLEEYMTMTARVLEIDGQFLYIPGCMIVSFDDASTHTTEVKVVRSAQGVDLGKLFDVHTIYKEVIHDVIGVEEATQRLDEIMKKRNKFSTWFLVLMHGCASASVGPFAFNARPIDMPVCFVLGCLLGILQLVMSPRSNIYQNVFEISATVLTSFLARAFGSIRYNGERIFCFSALAQSSIALILPGYLVLCASLELQSRSMVAGSVRMVYAIIYSLFLGFGITIGTAIYGLLDSDASTDYTCPTSPINNEYLQHFPFVLLFTFSLSVVNQAKWKQIPMMLVISFGGYVVNYFGSKRFSGSTQVSCALGAFVIGVMGNLYSRLRHGFAAAAMLPAIFVLVPSGLAASGSLVSGIASAAEITGGPFPYSVVSNGTQGFMDAAKNMSQNQSQNQFHGIVLDIGYGMVQVAIGFTVGLFLATLVVYPLGKKRSGLFSF